MKKNLNNKSLSNKNFEEKTICAISTPIGVGGIAIIRMSGSHSLDIANQIFFPFGKDKIADNPRKLILGKLNAGTFEEKCLTVYFKNPFSYTGEDMVEFQCHGGTAVAEGVLKACVNAGASLAEAGEFTKRAFINGKVSLDEAEGVIDVINAESESEIKAGYGLVAGNLKKQIEEIQERLTTILAKIEVTIDYPEEELEQETAQDALSELKLVLSDLNKIKESSEVGVKLKSGYRVSIIGKTNVGKSSLLNAMLNFDKAIVTNIQGTTRDLVEDMYVFNGVKFILTDSAGIRETDDVVEKIGVEKSKKLLTESDIVLFVVDGSEDIQNEDIAILSQLSDKNTILVVNKSDLFDKFKMENQFSKVWNGKKIFISAKDKENITTLKSMIFNMLIDNKILNSNILLTNVRHINLINDAIKFANQSIDAINNNMSLDMVSIDIQNVWNSLGEITGTSNTDEIINTIFSKFCVGK